MAKPGRKPLAIPTVEWKHWIPVDLAAEVELLLKDPVRDKVKYGARGELLTQLLRKWVDEQRQMVEVASTLEPDDHTNDPPPLA